MTFHGAMVIVLNYTTPLTYVMVLVSASKPNMTQSGKSMLLLLLKVWESEDQSLRDSRMLPSEFLWGKPHQVPHRLRSEQFSTGRNGSFR